MQEVNQINIDQSPMITCNQIIKYQTCQLSSRLELENENLPGKSFQWKKSHPLIDCKIKTIMGVFTKKIDNNDQQEEGKIDFPQYTKNKEGERQINEKKSLEWMDAQIKTKYVNISIDYQPKLEKIRDY